MSRHGSPLRTNHPRVNPCIPVWVENNGKLFLSTKGRESVEVSPMETELWPGGEYISAAPECEVTLFGVIWRSDAGWTPPHEVTFRAHRGYRIIAPELLIELEREGRLP